VYKLDNAVVKPHAAALISLLEDCSDTSNDIVWSENNHTNIYKLNFGDQEAKSKEHSIMQ